jgi:uncharacterized surface protein with fasciclin (FAS1) repeats
MKSTLKRSLLISLLVAAPTLAYANHCAPGMKYKKHGGHYDHPHPYMHHHPMYRTHHYRDHPGMYWQHEKPAMSGNEYDRDVKVDNKPSGAVTSDIIDTAINVGNFSTLIEAIKTAELEESLKSSGPFTVFAPSDEAFAKIPDKIRAAIIADKGALSELLTYHIIRGEVTSADVAGQYSATTLQGSDIKIDITNGVKVDGASVVAPDIRASNGIIHVIDSVLVPN